MPEQGETPYFGAVQKGLEARRVRIEQRSVREHARAEAQRGI